VRVADKPKCFLGGIGEEAHPGTLGVIAVNRHYVLIDPGKKNSKNDVVFLLFNEKQRLLLTNFECPQERQGLVIRILQMIVIQIL
jgi:hypothetical protein